MTCDDNRIPIIDVAPLVTEHGDVTAAAQSIREASCESGFFYVINHGIAEDLFERLEQVSREFFALDHATKMKIRMQLGGRAWRGYFPVGDELTSGAPDQKEGLYFGTELRADDPRVQAGTPLHGQNLFPAVKGFRETVLEYLQQMTTVGHALMRGIAISLGLDADYFHRCLTSDPIILFRIFHYPPLPQGVDHELWSVGEHTDYGLLTILKQDATGGLQVKSRGEWIEATPMPGTLVCNIGDMLDRMTGGRYRSTPHRVRNCGSQGRCSFPFFFDPGWNAEVKPIFSESSTSVDRWDGADLQELKGTYGEYLMSKVAKVFPELHEET